MPMKKLIISLNLFLLFATPALAFDPCHPDDVKYIKIAERYKTGLLFKISKCGAEPSYLLGTMHSDNPELTSLLRPAFAHLVYAKSASFEINFDNQTQKTVLAGMFYPTSGVETLQSAVGLELYNKFTQAMAVVHPETPAENYYNMKPWAAAVLLQEPPNTNDGIALDMRLENLAKSRGIPVYGLETAQEQLAVFETIPLDKQIEFLKDSVNQYQRINKDNKELDTLYMKQDLKGLQKLSDDSFNLITDQNFAHEMKINLVDKRNQKMVENMAPRIDAGNAFIALGALHLTSDVGVLRLLEDRGYFVDVVAETNAP